MQTFLHYRWRVPSTLHRLHPRRIIPLLLLALCVTGAKAQSDVKFNGDIRYSQWVIDSRMNNFYANTTKCGFAVYNQEGTQTSPRDDGKTKLDYVVGLVAKSIIEASQYYSQYDWAKSFAKPWFLSIQNYGDYFYDKFRSTSGSLDDLNAVKLFLPLRELTAPNATYANSTTYANTASALNTALTGLATHNSSYSIKSGTLAETAGKKDVLGGWWHKSDYENQMWLDGSYMGPALFAQLVNYSNKITNIDATNDWNLIVKQFTILRNMCWNSGDKLLYHAFAADGGTNSTSHSDTWYGLSSNASSYCFHSASYWGRAVGWYFLALVDVLEQMDNANLSSSEGYTTLKSYLTETAEGIKARQDQTTGGWYQILDKDSKFSASSYNNGKSHTTTYNYIESSATALFTAAYLKAIRKGYLNDVATYKTVAENGYKCLVNNFFSVDANGKVNIFGSCRSAGLGGKGDEYTAGKLKYRNGSREYYLLGNDVARVDKSENETEGKVLGAFIMAATEYEMANEKAIRFSYDLAPTYTLANGKSIKAEALGSGEISYKWYNASDDSEVSGAITETFTPKESGTYYCKATNGSTEIKTSETVVTVAAASNEGVGSENGSGSKTVTINKANPTSSDITCTISSGTSWNSDGYYAVNSGATITVEAKEGATISQIKLTYTATDKVGGTVTANPEGYNLSGTVGTWTGSANQVVFTTTNTARISSIEVTYTTGTTVLNESDLKYTQSYTNNKNAWTPKANGTIDVSELVSSSSTGAYSITSGNDVATISGTTITALKAGTFTLSQAADDTYKAGSIVITVRIGDNVTSDGTNKYSFTAQTTAVSDGMTITCPQITMTFGNDGFWSKPSAGSYTQGQKTPAVSSNNIPTSGTFYKFRATTTGSLQVKVKLGDDGAGKLRPLYVSENGTLVKAKKEDGTELDPAKMPEAPESYIGNITFPVKANTDYYVYVPGSKLGFYGFTFTPLTLYTVTFDAGTNGTCSTTSLMQESEGAYITLPSVTPKTGYKFDGWYTAGGTEIGVAEGTYQPTNNITLYAHYTKTSSGGGATSFSGVVSFTGTGITTTNEDVVSVASGTMKSKPAKITYNGKDYSNALKIGSSTSVTLTLTAKSDVVLVFNSTNQGNTIKVDGTAYPIGTDGTITVPELGSGTHTITRGDGESQFYAVDIQPAGASLTITTQPVSADYLQGATAVELSVDASIVNGTTSDYNFSYQWYSNDEESTTNATAIGEPTTEPSCTPDVTVIGTKYYYCVVTATKGTEVLTATSDFAKVTVNGPTVTFTTQPQGAVYKKSSSGAAPLTVAATTNFKGTVKYQWYSNDTGTIPNPVADNEKISNADSDTYTPLINTEGKKYYYCIASSTYGSSVYKEVSDLVCVEVVTALYSYNVQGKTTPKCNESRSIVDDSGKTLVTFTFGGWKYNNNRYLKPNAENIDANYITDEWVGPATQEVNALDGYQYAISGKNDAVQENKAEETTMYKKTRYGWFQSPTRNTDGVTTDSHPYTLPVRGAYMTFEPTQNGTLTIYLLQNGAWNSDKNNNIDIIPGEFRMHAFQITNQRGLVLAEFAPKYSITTNQKVADGYSCSKYLDTDKPKTFDKTSKDISNWEEFWALKETERKAVHDNWNNGINGSQTIIKLEDGSFLAIQKAIVKYEFHVTGNETYYLFSNFSKLGFSGATFQPDAAQPTDDTTFSGDGSLSDTKAYKQITWTTDGTKIPETELTKYTYKIGDNDVELVDGVYIPQFKAITLERTFKPNQWTTLTLPFNLTQTEVEQIFGKGTEILVFKDAITTNGTKLHIKFIYHEIQNILPGYPYLIKPTLKDDKGNAMTTKGTSTDNAPIYTIDNTGSENPILKSFTVYGKAINPHIKQYEFKSKDNQYVAKGTPGYCKDENGDIRKKYEEGDLFISEGDGKLYISQGLSYGNGYRSYIDYTGTETSSAATKTLSLTFSGVDDGEGDGTTTEISVAELADDVIEAFGIKGVYNLNGQKVAETTRNLPAGIYVVNGRKVVVK